MSSAWDRLARSRDEKSGDRGDLWHRALIDPAVRRLIGPVRGLRLLEVGCGNGYLARSLAARGADGVVGIDRSSPSIRLARARERGRPRGVRFEVGDAGRLPFANGTFDLVVANMALMDIRDAATAIREAARVLVPEGRLVFSISHPCFDVDDRSVWSVERGFGPDGVYRDTVYRKVRGYRDERRALVPWRVGPRAVVWTDSYHRTLTTYSRYLRAAGLAIVRLEEPSPRAELLTASPQGRLLREIPLHLVVEAARLGVARPGWRTRARNRPAAARRSGSGGRTADTGSVRRGSKHGS
jgi:ubiquinone/menaquinone biosynthesis C-methylase UbiE